MERTGQEVRGRCGPNDVDPPGFGAAPFDDRLGRWVEVIQEGWQALQAQHEHEVVGRESAGTRQ